MAEATPGPNASDLLAPLNAAAEAGHLTSAAADHVRIWLTEPRYAEYAGEVAEHIVQQKWKELDDAFWTIIPFGTGGRRGRMYPIGCNAINDRTIGESAQGLAECVKAHHDGKAPLACAIAYDTRRNSRRFAELCAGIMAAAGFQVYFLDDYRSTPELSFMVRHKNCSCGIMVTASHNPPSDNAVKVYWSTGGQVLPPYDQEIIDRVMNAQEIRKMDFQEGVDQGKIEICTAEIDQAFVAAVQGRQTVGPRDVKIIYSPLHGVGSSAVLPVLEAGGFNQVELFGPHAEPDGAFPNVPENVSNPENPRVFDAMIERAKETGAELLMATDPDCDRMGCAAPLTLEPGAAWETFTGNQIGALLADYVLEQTANRTPEHYLVKTLVTTEMIRRIGDSYNAPTYGNLQVGFKYIGGLMDEKGPDKFVFGTEESHGYLVGQYARDKDGAVACMLLAELAAKAKAAGQSLHEKLDALYWQHGYHAEQLLNVKMPGSEGMANMQRLMEKFRQDPPSSLSGLPVKSVRDYLNQQTLPLGGAPEPLGGPIGNLVILDLGEEGNYVAVRPSGTEPKVKFYMFTYVPAEQLADLEQTKDDMQGRLRQFEDDLRAFAGSV